MLTWLALAIAALLQPAPPAPTPERAVEALLAEDRAFAARAATRPLAEGLTAMFAPDVIVPGPPARLYRGLADVKALLEQSPDAAARASWTPVGAGLSGDGQHGFTFGVMTLTHSDGRTVPLKYMAYWIKGAAGWRVAGYKRARRPEGAADTTALPPHLPAALVAPRTDAAWLDAQRASLVSAEKAFSDAAQRLGLGPAFVEYGLPNAVNMGAPTSAAFVIGAQAIGTLVGGGRPPGPPSPVEWSSDLALVASSGDLGISFGFIRPTERPAGGAAPQGQPFFTIWSRPSPDAPWRYIAE